MPEVRFRGATWLVRLSNVEASNVSIVLGSLAPLVKVSAATLAALGIITGPIGAAIVAAVGGSAGYIYTVNLIGGNNGVDVHGIVGSHGLIVTPRAFGFYEKLMQGAQVGVTAGTIGEFILKAAAAQPGLSSSLGLKTAAEIFARVSGGTPLGWAVAGAMGAVINLLLPEPDPDQHGAIHANRDHVGPWEEFVVEKVGPGEQVALQSWQGFLSARGGGGGPVFANRPWVQDWERWSLLRHSDGTVSLKSFNGKYFVAEGGGGSVCNADRPSAGPWEKFDMVPLRGGKFALRTIGTHDFVSVQA